MNGFESILLKLPEQLRIALEALPWNIQNSLEEIRIKINEPVIIKSEGKEIHIMKKGEVTRSLLDITMNNLMNYSTYAYADEISKGYITIEGGHRVGICGRVVKDNDNVTLIKDISSINIRRSREIKGVADSVIKKIIDRDLGLQNTVIVSPPKCGKTTMLRDIVRILSYDGMRIGVCDERSEIAGMYQGIPSFDLGPRTDILDGCNKAEGTMMLIRSMAPDVIVTDEIGTEDDVRAIEAAVCAGISLITTIHGHDYDDLMQSRLGEMIRKKIFRRVIVLSCIPSTGTVSEVINV